MSDSNTPTQESGQPITPESMDCRDRFIISKDYKDVQQITLMSRDAYIGPITQFPEFVRECYTANSDVLLDIIDACTERLKHRINYEAQKVEDWKADLKVTKLSIAKAKLKAFYRKTKALIQREAA